LIKPFTRIAVSRLRQLVALTTEPYLPQRNDCDRFHVFSIKAVYMCACSCRFHVMMYTWIQHLWN